MRQYMRPSDLPWCTPGPIRARSADQPADDSRTALATDVPWSHRLPRRPCKAAPPHPPWIVADIGPNFLLHPEAYTSLHPPMLRNAIRAYDVSPYWVAPTVMARLALSGEVVCKLGPEFSMLGVYYFSRVIDAEYYVSSVLQWPVKVVFIGSIRAPKSDWKIAEMLLREKTNTIFVQPVPM